MKPVLIALTACAALSVPAAAGDRHGHRGSNGNGSARTFRGPSSSGGATAARSFHPGSSARFSSARTPGSQRFSSGYRPRSNSQRLQAGTFNRNQTRQITHFQNNRIRNFNTAQNRNLAFHRNQAFRNGNHRLGNGNHHLGNANNHIVARHAANWHSDWDRHHDHWWHGHRCHFHNGSWVVFDVGFFPWWGWDYPYYPYNSYYPYGYNYGYGSGYDYGYEYNQPYDSYNQPYDSSQVYDGADPEQVEPNQDEQEPTYYDSSNQTIDSTVAAIQERLTRDGYYKGEIDGVLGPATRYALVRYQSSNGLQVTGTLTPDTIRSLGAQQVARE